MARVVDSLAGHMSTTQSANLESLHTITLDQLSFVAGAAGEPASDFGRCGPGSSWKWLGNVYTPQCATHDAKVRNAQANGTSAFMSHVKALPWLPAAVGSYVKARFQGQK